MKVLKIIKNIILGILGIAFFLFAISMTILLLNYNDYGVTQFGDTSLILIKDSLATEEFQKGDLVLVKTKKLEDIKIGDSVFAYSINRKGAATGELGRIGNTYADEKAVAYENGATYSMEFVIGEATKVYPNIGTYLSIIESKWGFLFIILVPGFLIFIYEVYALIVEIKYGDEDEEQA